MTLAIPRIDVEDVLLAIGGVELPVRRLEGLGVGGVERVKQVAELMVERRRELRRVQQHLLRLGPLLVQEAGVELAHRAREIPDLKVGQKKGMDRKDPIDWFEVVPILRQVDDPVAREEVGEAPDSMRTGITTRRPSFTSRIACWYSSKIQDVFPLRPVIRSAHRSVSRRR